MTLDQLARECESCLSTKVCTPNVLSTVVDAFQCATPDQFSFIDNSIVHCRPVGQARIDGNWRFADWIPVFSMVRISKSASPEGRALRTLLAILSPVLCSPSPVQSRAVPCLVWSPFSRRDLSGVFTGSPSCHHLRCKQMGGA
jgi:hypothetical protein